MASDAPEDFEREAAVEDFTNRATQHARYALTHARGRILFVATIAIVLSTVVILVAVDSSRTSAARRYAAAMQWNQESSLRCDAALGRRRFWLFGVVSGHDLCTYHPLRDSEYKPKEWEPGMRFLVLGDWGRDGMCCQHDVALEMAEVGMFAKPGPSFVVSTGDNFYLNGIENSRDGQVDRSWRDVYIRPYESLRVPWKMTLGNHDYEGNVAAQKVLGRDDKYWHMPDFYYFESVGEGSNEVFMAFLDTTVLYYTEEQFKQFRGELSIYKRDNQVAALRKALSSSRAKWKLVFGHHPLYSSGENSLSEQQNLKQMRTMLLHIFKENHVAAYFSGHEHLMEHLIVDGVHLFISGAGSKLSPINSNLDESVFVLDRQGFLNVIVRNDTAVMTVRMVDLDGAVVHEANVTRP